jgi:hypothetical protein
MESSDGVLEQSLVDDPSGRLKPRFFPHANFTEGQYVPIARSGTELGIKDSNLDAKC